MNNTKNLHAKCSINRFFLIRLLAAEKKNQNTRRVTGHIAAAAATTATKD
jgi:hypothetical protein